jgi:hypothetical protein
MPAILPGLALRRGDSILAPFTPRETMSKALSASSTGSNPIYRCSSGRPLALQTPAF